MAMKSLKENSFIGIKWVTALSILAAPLSYGVNVLLGKISPEVLGTYGLLMLSASLIPTFLLFGGNQVVVRYLPALDDRKKLSFVVSYATLVLVLAGVALLWVKVNPGVVSYVSSRDLEARLLPYLVPLVPILLVFHIATATLWAHMEIKWMTICQKSNVILSFLGAGVLFVLFSRIPQELMPELIGGLVLLSFTLGLIVALYYVYTKVIVRYSLILEWFLPAGFWRFAMAIYLGTFFWLALERFDQALVWSRFSVTSLGLYRAPLATAEIVRWLPKITAQVAFPLFANLLAEDRELQVVRSYGIVTKYTVLAASIVALPLVLFAHEVLGLFGASYLEGDMILTVLAGAFILSAISTINAGLLVAHGQSGLIILNGIVPSVVQIPVALLLIGRFGLIGVALAKALALASYTVANSLMVAKLWNVKPQRNTILVLMLDVGVITVSQVFTPPNFFLKALWSVALLTGFAFSLLILKILTKEDLQLFLKLLVGRAYKRHATVFSRLPL